MTKTQITVALVGIGGYGENYVSEILNNGSKHNVKLVAAIDPASEKCRFLKELKELGVRFYSQLSDFFAEESADFVVISAPIHLHTPLACMALEQGANVLCEKPLTATVQEARQMAEAQERTGKFIAVGYQWSFSTAIKNLKHDIHAGLFGQPVRLKTLVCWPRSSAYYARNDWAGKIRSKEGAWILDSPANNATAHYLHNMFYVLGDEPWSSAIPANVTAELYRANPIQNFDTAAIRCQTDRGVEILFYTTHAVQNKNGPVFCYEFENGTVYYDAENNEGIQARLADGRTKSYGNPQTEPNNKLWESIDACRTSSRIVCDVNSALSQVICINAAQESSSGISNFDHGFIKQNYMEDDSKLIWVKGLQEDFRQCYECEVLPSENDGIKWAKAGNNIDVTNYRAFPQTTKLKNIK